MKEIVEMYRRMAAVQRASAKEWRAMALDAPDAFAFLMLRNAEANDMQAAADESRADKIENPQRN